MGRPRAKPRRSRSFQGGGATGGGNVGNPLGTWKVGNPLGTGKALGKPLGNAEGNADGNGGNGGMVLEGAALPEGLGPALPDG